MQSNCWQLSWQHIVSYAACACYYNNRQVGHICTTHMKLKSHTVNLIIVADIFCMACTNIHTHCQVRQQLMRYIYTHTHIYSHVRTHEHTHVHTHNVIHTRTHMHTYTYTHTHTHTQTITHSHILLSGGSKTVKPKSNKQL